MGHVDKLADVLISKWLIKSGRTEEVKKGTSQTEKEALQALKENHLDVKEAIFASTGGAWSQTQEKEFRAYLQELTNGELYDMAETECGTDTVSIRVVNGRKTQSVLKE